MTTGLDIYGMDIFADAKLNKANMYRNKIEKKVRSFELLVKKMEDIHVHCPDSDKALQFPVKFKKNVKYNLFKYLTNRLKYEREGEDKPKLKKKINFKISDLAGCMVNVNEENDIIVGSIRRVEEFYNFFESQA